jgi:AraC-like DNA-binding protein
MDNICVELDHLIRHVITRGLPPIPFCGRPFSGYANPPAPHLLLGLLLEPGIPDLDLGDRCVVIPPRHLFLHSVHMGNRTSVSHRLSAWCLFLSVDGVSRYDRCYSRSVFAAVPVATHIPELEAGFSCLAAVCVRHGEGSQRYFSPHPMWDTTRHGRQSPTATAHVTSALLELLARTRDAATLIHAGSSIPTSILRSLEHMCVHLGDPSLDLPRLANAIGLNVDHFGRIFRSSMGMSPMQHLKRLRLHQAGRLLADTAMPISTIARMVGFNDPLHFSREFRRGMGTSPSGWRIRPLTT